MVKDFELQSISKPYYQLQLFCKVTHMVAEKTYQFFISKKKRIIYHQKKGVWEEEGAIYATLVPTYLPT
jgi:hypothetical protein